ncbi:proline iminopeptidase protein [Sanghuangporus baumii]|uniref:Proline iminopeptidase protein n=1 Tax=Sanghuangporus baumii TaxID=108892 RepID=A0A9Q5NF32_SANBA|nr:proline iminopeptidase protein [Sanghuangporus baumii]
MSSSDTFSRDILPTKEGKLPFTYQGETYETYYKVVGNLDSTAGVPLVTLHGGPGSAHHYLLALSDLVSPSPSSSSSETGTNAVIFYDQLGTGNSSHPRDSKAPSFWTPELFMEELANLLAGLGVSKKYDLLGHSWGGMLAAQFASAFHNKQLLAGLRKLILSSAPASMALFEQGCAKLVKELPADVQETLRRHEEDGTTDSKEYEEAVGVFYERHLCRVKPFPRDLVRSFECIGEDPTVYHTMNGPSEFHITGSLRTWSIIPSIPAISVPTLLLSGAHDEVQEECIQPFFDGIMKAGVKWAVFAESSHVAHLEERERYIRIVRAFLGGN